MAQDIVRVLRVIEYTGDRAAVERQLKGSLANGEERTFPWYENGQNLGNCTIRVATIGTFPEILKKAEDSNG